MKINIEDYLHRIDTAFKEKEQKEIYMTYIMIAAGIFAFSYFFFWESSFESFEETRANVESLQSKIKADETYLQRNPESKIAQLESDIENIKAEMLLTKDNNAYIKSKIETISSLIYDERAWGEYIDSISKNAEKYSVKITNFSNRLSDNGNSFGHVLDIHVVSTANYKNTLKFINSLEQSNLVVDIHDLNISAQKKLVTDLNLSVWGITY